MKIGLISINIHTNELNFACPIHTVAFQSFLADNGVDATVIDYIPRYAINFDTKHPLHHYQKYPPKDKPEMHEVYLDRWEKLFKEREIRYDKFEAFTKKYYTNKTPEEYTAKKLDTVSAGFDCYICVTDVIW
jgi:hypothetical protein